MTRDSNGRAGIDNMLATCSPLPDPLKNIQVAQSERRHTGQQRQQKGEPGITIKASAIQILHRNLAILIEARLSNNSI